MRTVTQWGRDRPSDGAVEILKKRRILRVFVEILPFDKISMIFVEILRKRRIFTKICRILLFAKISILTSKSCRFRHLRFSSSKPGRSVVRLDCSARAGQLNCVCVTACSYQHVCLSPIKRALAIRLIIHPILASVTVIVYCRS
jgi:hypothetical protein